MTAQDAVTRGPSSHQKARPAQAVRGDPPSASPCSATTTTVAGQGTAGPHLWKGAFSITILPCFKQLPVLHKAFHDSAHTFLGYRPLDRDFPTSDFRFLLLVM